jgi:nucleoside-diphosphate-sugar epimerase
MKRVLVTGGTGFVGSEALPFLLQRGYEVHLLGRKTAYDRSDLPAATSLHVHQCDLIREDWQSLVADIQPTHLLHLAWCTEHGAFWWTLGNLDWVAASLRLVRAFAAAGGTRAVLAGTCAEYDWSFDTLDEAATPLRPATLYGTAKLSLFQLMQSAQQRLALSFAWGRIFFPYGPRDQAGKLLSAVIDGVSAGQTVACSEGLQIRSFIYVEDVARAFVELLESDVTGAVNIATGEASSVRDMVAHAAALSGDASLVQFGARPMQKGEPPLLRATTRRLFEEVGFQPRFTLKDGVARTVQVRAADRANGRSGRA